MGDRAAQPLFHVTQPLLQALRDLPDVLPQILKAPLQRRRVGHHVALPLAQYDPLGGAQPAHAERQRHATQQRRHGERGGGERDDSLGVGEAGGGHADKLSRGRTPSRIALQRGFARNGPAPIAYGWNSARYEPLLFSRLVSPGTGCT